MRIAIAGTRGVPAGYGGFETFAENLALRLLAKGYNVTVINDKENIPSANYVIPVIHSLFSKREHPVRFYYDSLKKASSIADIILMCGVGAAPFYPFFRDVPIITNIDGLEHLRSKFSFIKKEYVKVSQRFASKYSSHIVADSAEVGKWWSKAFSKAKFSVIGYGAEFSIKPDTSILTEFSLQPQEYFLVVARMVPENNLPMIIEAYRKSGVSKKLVIVSTIENNRFSNSMLSYKSEFISFAGSVYDKTKLDALRSNAYGYIHGHSVGGTNPSLIEAMVAGCFIFAHNNLFNREVCGEFGSYFENADELATQLSSLNVMRKQKNVIGQLKRIQNDYNWDTITNKYIELFKSVYAK